MNAAIDFLGGEQREDSKTVAEALKALGDAIQGAQDLTGTQKKEALEVLGEIGKTIQTPPEKRSAGVIKSLLGGLGSLLSAGKTVSDLWQTYGPVLRGYFGA